MPKYDVCESLNEQTTLQTVRKVGGTLTFEWVLNLFIQIKLIRSQNNEILFIIHSCFQSTCAYRVEVIEINATVQRIDLQLLYCLFLLNSSLVFRSFIKQPSNTNFAKFSVYFFSVSQMNGRLLQPCPHWEIIITHSIH